MRYATAAAFRQALEQRIKTLAGADNPAIQRLRKRVTTEGEDILPDQEIRAYRFNAQASLAERIFESFVLDVGTMTPLVVPPDDIDGSGILDFSGIPPKRFRTVSLGQQVAEKIHAFTFPWKDRENTRVKDLVDVVLILEVSPPDPRTTRIALEAVFSARAAHPLPTSLPHPPGSWANSYSASAKELGLIHNTTEDATRFLGQYWARVFP